MAAVPWNTVKAAAPASITAGGTRYLYFGQGADASVTSNTTETPPNLILRTAGTFSKLAMRVVTNDRTTNSTVTFRKNTADGSQALSITALTTGVFQDTTNTDSVSAGDSVCVKLVVGTGGTTFSTNGWGALFAASSNTSERFHVNWANATVSDTTFINLCGSRVSSANEDWHSAKALVAGTVKNWAVRINSNSRDGATTFKSRKNSADGNGAISVTASTSGNFEDTSNSDTIAQDDLFAMQVAFSGTTGLITVTWLARDFETTNGQAILHNADTSGNIAFGATRYSCVSGGGGSWPTTETDAQFPALAAVTASRLTCYVTSNGIAASHTLTLRVAGSDTSLSLSITASTTGRFNDDTNTASVSNLDLLSLKLVTGGASGLMALSQASVNWGDSSAGASSGQPAAKRMLWIPFGAHGRQPRRSVWG